MSATDPSAALARTPQQRCDGADQAAASDDALPGALQPLAECLVYSAYRPSDDFDDRQRKAYLAVAAGNAVFLSLYAILFGVLVATVANAATILGLVCAVLYALVGPVLYTVMRVTGRAPPVLIDIYIGAVIVGITSLMLTTNLPLISSLVLVVIVATQSGCTVLWLHLLVATIALSIATYNEIAMGMKWPFARVPGWQKVTMPVMLTQCAFVYLMYMVSGFAMLRIGVARRKALTRATVSASTAVALADALVDYDTERVRDTIGAAEGEADGMLLKAFAAMCANLEVYRPHLPNWLLQRQQRRVHGEEEEDEDSASLQSSFAQKVESLAGSARFDEGSQRSFRNVPHGGDSSSDQPSTDGPQLLVSRPSSSHLLLEAQQRKLSDRMNSQQAAMTHSTRSQTVTVAAAVVHYSLGAAATDADVNAFVGAVYSAAAATRGSVHAFVGDAVLLSWNATTRVPQPETKAARCLLKLKAWLASSDGAATTAVASGAVMTGQARCQVAGTALRAPTVSAPWFGALRGLAQHACSFGQGVFLADEATRRSAKFELELLPVDRVAFCDWRRSSSGGGGDAAGSTPEPKPSIAMPNTTDDCPPPSDGATASSPPQPQRVTAVVYELVRAFDVGNDEWMYVLESQGKASSPGGLLETAAQHAATGDYSAAVATLGDLPDAVLARPTVAALQKKLVECATASGALPSDSGSAQFATVLAPMHGLRGGG